jgi:2-desacetyl-2-hydroxyethyl bacteriochlorophyllide A dehydrogenase
MKRMSLVFTAPYQVELVEESIAPPSQGEALVVTALSAISPGTERLIYQGQAPLDLPADTKLSSLEGDLSYPLRYGYAAVGHVREVGAGVDREWLDQPVFSFQPHTSAFTTETSNLIRLPDDLALEDAAFLPNMETAVNFLQDGAPLFGERVLVLGQGIVGLLTTSLLAQLPIAQLITLDPQDTRRTLSIEAGADASFNPEQEESLAALGKDLVIGSDHGGADLIYELSGTPKALNLAFRFAGFSARILIGSWYGTKRAADLDLGGAFHRQRLTITSSQVSTIHPSLSGRWSKQRRLALALQTIKDVKPSKWVTHRFEIQQAQQAYQQLDDSHALQVILTYGPQASDDR